MMDGGMGSMTGGMMAFGWLGVVLFVLLLVGAIVALVRLLTPSSGTAQGSGANILWIVFAVIGVLALLGLLGGLFMHLGIGGMMR